VVTVGVARRQLMIGAVGVEASTVPIHGTGPGASPRTALHQLRVMAIPNSVAKQVMRRHHYLHSIPGGTSLAFGVFKGGKLVGVVTLGVGSVNGYRLFDGADRGDCLTLTRLWLADELPSNSESRVLGIIRRSLRRHTDVKFLVTYADPSHGHVGTIYQAAGWLYTGLSQQTPLYDVGDGRARHSRSFSQEYGTRSARHFALEGVEVRQLPVSPKHRYVLFLDQGWADRLRIPVLPYPKMKGASP
jgi:hypothetical protein